MESVNSITVTEFAPAFRAASSEIQRQRKLIESHYGPVRQFYDAVSEIILILNENRQIVFFNKHVPLLLKKDPDSLYGIRPGEALGCMYDGQNAAGCGTSKFCSECGAVHAVLNALSTKADIRECRIQQSGGNAFDLLVKTSPLHIQNEIFCIVAITDISHEKRRRMLERIFFHDIMNTAVGIRMLSNMIGEKPDPEAFSEYRQSMSNASSQLIEEIKSHKEFLAAESNELKPDLKVADATDLMDELFSRFAPGFKDAGIHLSVAYPARSIRLQTDPVLLKRVLGNMLKNALEASSSGQTVTFSVETVNDQVEFSVHNQSVIPRSVQFQIFQRSFSTKGTGRGIGTYSMKLLSERYLKGRVDFISSRERGTTFTACYPAQH